MFELPKKKEEEKNILKNLHRSIFNVYICGSSLKLFLSRKTEGMTL
jgi:hypothetical protein